MYIKRTHSHLQARVALVYTYVWYTSNNYLHKMYTTPLQILSKSTFPPSLPIFFIHPPSPLSLSSLSSLPSPPFFHLSLSPLHSGWNFLVFDSHTRHHYNFIYHLTNYSSKSTSADTARWGGWGEGGRGKGGGGDSRSGTECGVCACVCVCLWACVCVSEQVCVCVFE